MRILAYCFCAASSLHISLAEVQTRNTSAKPYGGLVRSACSTSASCNGTYQPISGAVTRSFLGHVPGTMQDTNNILFTAYPLEAPKPNAYGHTHFPLMRWPLFWKTPKNISKAVIQRRYILTLFDCSFAFDGTCQIILKPILSHLNMETLPNLLHGMGTSRFGQHQKSE